MIADQLNDQRKFNDNEKRIADYFLRKEEDLREISARKAAQELYVSPSTVTRFCERLGFKGYPDFVRQYCHELERRKHEFQDVNANYPFHKEDAGKKVAEKVVRVYKDVLDDIEGLLKEEDLQKAAAMLSESRIIHIVASGSYLSACGPFREKMMKIGFNVALEAGGDLAYYTAANAKTDECFIFLSYSGEVKNTLRPAQKAREKHLPSISLTSYGDNSLRKLCDLNFSVSTREKMQSSLGDYSMTLSVIFYLDLLYSLVFQKNYMANSMKKKQLTKEFEVNRKSDNPILKD